MDVSTKKDRPVILTAEQALSMSSATLRFAQLGWRVIRLEPTPAKGRAAKGDPNRYIGREVAGEDRHSYFVAPNVGKEAIAVDLKRPEGRELLCRLIRELDVDVFCTNTLPARHEALGLGYERLAEHRPDLIWCCISAMGLGQPTVPGYDPMVQALCGYMDLTGDPQGPPMQCGPPLIDLKAGDEAFAQILLALLEREQTGRGKQIDVSMTRCAASWLLTFLPMLEMGSPPEELRRSGNAHRQFIPTNAYPTSDGFVYMALGSDAQWQRLVAHEYFRALDRPQLATNEGRRANREKLYEELGELTARYPTAAVTEAMSSASVPNAPIKRIEEVMQLSSVARDLLRTTAPDGTEIRLPPAACSTPNLERSQQRVPFAPGYAEHTDAVLNEAGLSSTDVADLRQSGVVA